MKIKPLRRRLDEMSKKNALRLDIIQQDYLLSWVLVGVFQHPYLKSHLIFKGGTALKKGYFGEYRFSEDLDFTLKGQMPSNMLQLVTEACQIAEKQMQKYAPISIYVKTYEEKHSHPEGQKAFTVHAQFPWQPEPLTKAMIEISQDEIMVFEPVRKNLIHNYGEPIELDIYLYSLEEIILEKLRAILQHTKKLYERDWTRSRARDYYDLWRILTSFEENLSLNDLVLFLRKKCALKRVNFKDIESFFDPTMVNYVCKTWKTWLGPLVPQTPDSEFVINELREKLKALFISFDEKLSSVIQFMAQKKLKGKALYDALKKAIHRAVNVNQQTPNGHQFLQLLINSNLDPRQKLDLVKTSISLGAKLDGIDRSERTPYQTAIVVGDKAIADFLLEKGASNKVPLSIYEQYYRLYFRMPSP